MRKSLGDTKQDLCMFSHAASSGLQPGKVRRMYIGLFFKD